MNYLRSLIDQCMKGGGLSLSDIARWLDKPIPTVRGWHTEHRVPRDYNVHVVSRMEKLKRLVDDKPPGEFFPKGTSERNRRQLITELRDATFSVPTEGATT